MKAVVMAGGEGSRLRPLTCGRPKPMVPVLNRPVMQYIVDLLKKHGFTEIAVTLQYQPQAIKDYFGSGTEWGVSFRYFVEETPLGTAGSVKNAASFLDETFLVISGDALTDLDLSMAVKFHKEHGALATLVLTRVECPLEYGVVITESDGRIKRFLEKPGWSEVFSDTVNTGIYVLEPEVLDYFAPGQMFDFSQDLFPLLLRENKPLYGVVLSGYWCDIGSIGQYMEAHCDVLAGRVNLSLPGKEAAPGIRVEEGAVISEAAQIRGPVFIGANCQIGPGAKIEPYTVLGSGCLIGENASIKRSVLWNNVYVGKNAALRGAVVGSRVQVQAGAGIYEGAVVGDDSIIRENGLLKPDVKLWPKKFVDTGATVGQSLVWGSGQPKKIFGYEGISGLVNVEITPDFAARAGTAFGSVAGAGARLAVSSDGYPYSFMIKEALAMGMASAGARVVDLGECVTPLHRFGVRWQECSGGVHVKVNASSPEKVTLVFTNGRGGNIKRGMERKIENVLSREDFLRAQAGRIERPVKVRGLARQYAKALAGAVGGGFPAAKRLKVVLGYESQNLGGVVSEVAAEFGFELCEISTNEQSGRVSVGQWRVLVPEVTERVAEEGADLGAVLDPNADCLVLVDEKGRVIEGDLLTALLSLILLESRGGPVVVPVTAPRVIEDLAQRYRGKVVRTKTALQDFWENLLALEDGENMWSSFFVHFDALCALAVVGGFLVRTQTPLSGLVGRIPSFYTGRGEVAVPWEARGRLIRQLIENPPAPELELLDGVKVYHPEGWALVLPDPDEPVCRVFAEGASMEIAESLTDMYLKKISEIVGQK